MDSSLTALGVEHIDLYQVHPPDPSVPVEESVAALAELQREGKFRHVGVWNFSVDQLRRARVVGPVVSNQVPYHLFRRDAESELWPFAKKHNIRVLVYGPLAHGLLTGAVDERTRFEAGELALDQPCLPRERTTT